MIIEMIKKKKEQDLKDQQKLKQLILNNNELTKQLKNYAIDSIELEKALKQLDTDLNLQEDILVDLFNFFQKSSDRFISIQEKMKSEKNLKKDDKKKKNNNSKKLKDRDLNDELKDIKNMVNYLLDFLEKETIKK